MSESVRQNNSDVHFWTSNNNIITWSHHTSPTETPGVTVFHDGALNLRHKNNMNVLEHTWLFYMVNQMDCASLYSSQEV